MAEEKYKVKAAFFYVTEIEGFEGDIFAVFPKEIYAFDNKIVWCYAHIGQHHGCHLSFCRDNSRLATPEKYESLKKELESIGYELEILENLENYYEERL